MKRICVVILGLFILSFPFICWAQPQQKVPVPYKPKELKIERGLAPVEAKCIECHSKEQPGRVHDWAQGAHARANITCLDCHKADPKDPDAMDCPGTIGDPQLKISPIVSPKDCSRCHPREFKEFERTKHARTIEIIRDEIKDPWLKGMANEVECSTGCFMCHGSLVKVVSKDGKRTLEPYTWPNEGCGRLNPDGSKGTCAMCHTAHIFSLAEARRPESCGQCHLGPDHPQKEIYFESKHGLRYQAEGNKWNWDAAPGTWQPGKDFTAPTCAACHVSGVGPLATTQDLATRLKWESEAPSLLLNKDFNPDKGRENMLTVCIQCHSKQWAQNYMYRFDKTMENYGNQYFKPAKRMLDELYTKGLLTKWPFFDEKFEWDFYELWHHQGRRARMGAMMMGPEYTWWRGFYDLKKIFLEMEKLYHEALNRGKAQPKYIPGATGKNITPLKGLPKPIDVWKKTEGCLMYGYPLGTEEVKPAPPYSPSY